MTAKKTTKLVPISPELEWNRIDIREAPLTFAVGASVMSEFVLGHDHIAVLKELVQNEYDAAGTRVDVTFTNSGITVCGTGKTIDGKGWRRLSVMMGTGRVGGTDEVVDPKVNGIGSKNFGLRSMFLYGNEIYIRSGGRQTVLEISKGAMPTPVFEATSRNKPGVQIFVPFRAQKLDKLDVFTVEKEVAAFDGYADELISNLLKLSPPSKEAPKKGIKEVNISSSRCNRVLRLKQVAAELNTHNKSLQLYKRSSIFSDTNTSRSERIEEYEFIKKIKVPEKFKEIRYPAYYKGAGGYIQISLSIRTIRGKFCLEHPGLFYYPLGVSRGFTGTPLSISAPFEMDADRSKIVGVNNSEWNKWLLDEAAKLAIDLIVTELTHYIGIRSVLICKQVIEPLDPYFLQQVERLIAEQACWPTRERTKRPKIGPVFSKVSDIVIPAKAAFDNFLSPSRYLDATMEEVAELGHYALQCGAKLFDVNSLVRLRCYGKETVGMVTKIDGKTANYYYTDFPRRLQELEVQLRFAKAFDASGQISKPNKQDLETSKTTLAASGELNSPGAPMYVIPEEIAVACPVPKLEVLHQELSTFKYVSHLCKKYNLTEWIKNVVGKIKSNTCEEVERTALYHFILEKSGEFNRNIISLLYKCPVLLDHSSRWTSPAQITLETAQGAQLITEVLHFPNDLYKNNPIIARKLRFKSKISEEEIIEYAKFLAHNVVHSPKFELLLSKNLKHLKKSSLHALGQVSFLVDHLGRPGTPQKLYIRNQLNQSCLQAAGPYVSGSRNQLYIALGCMEQPQANDIVASLRRLCGEKLKPERPEILYPALVAAMKRENIKTDAYADEAILWDGTGYCKPKDTLLGPQHYKVFLEAVPQFAKLTETLSKAYKALGAFERPTPYHWELLIHWYSTKNFATPIVNRQERASLREMYCRINTPDLNIKKEEKWLLDRKGRLFSMKDVTSRCYLIDDDPSLAEAIGKMETNIAFADISDSRTLKFYHKINVSKLTQVRRKLSHKIGTERPFPKKINITNFLRRIVSTDFASALIKLIISVLSSKSHITQSHLNNVSRMLKLIKAITLVDKIYSVYNVNSHVVTVGCECLYDKGNIYITAANSKQEVTEQVAYALAEIYSTITDDIRVIADGIFRLLLCGNSTDMQLYLKRRGISWSFRSKEPGVEGEEGLDSDLIDGLASSLTDAQEEEPKNFPSQDVEPDDSDVDAEPVVPLPPITDVMPTIIDKESTWEPTDKKPGKSGGRAGGWRSPTGREQCRDSEVGRRGEELVFLSEIERVTKNGYPESSVVWTSKNDAGANHDIESIDDHGKKIWIEVKSTTGTDGKFHWSKREFSKALKEGSRYILARVYQADTVSPTIKMFRNPIRLLNNNVMRIDIATLYAELEPLKP